MLQSEAMNATMASLYQTFAVSTFANAIVTQLPEHVEPVQAVEAVEPVQAVEAVEAIHGMVQSRPIVLPLLPDLPEPHGQYSSRGSNIILPTMDDLLVTDLLVTDDDEDDKLWQTILAME